MKVTPVATPHAVMPSNANPSAQADARAKAIAAFTTTPGGNHSPSMNQNAISAEDMTAIVPKAKRLEDDTQMSGQNGNDEQVQDLTDDSSAGVETPKAETEVPKEDTALSRQFAQLARQEKALRQKVAQQEQSIKAKEAELATREAAIAAKDQEYRSGYIPKSRLTQDTWGALNEAGISYEQLTEQVINQSSPIDPRVQSHIAKLEARLEELQQKAEGTEKTFKQQQDDAYKSAIRQITTDVTKLVEKNPDDFEAIAKTGSTEDVVTLIEETFKKDGILLSVEEAAQQIEDYLIEEAFKVTEFKKIKTRMSSGNASQSTQAPGKPAGINSETKQPQQMKTLTNATSGSRKPTARERAMMAFKGELK